MYISKVNINNFRSLKEVSVSLNKTNILIGPNNAGKTSFFDAINYAIGWNYTNPPREDDFFVEDSTDFFPQEAKPIEVILEFREGFKEDERFSENIGDDFEGVIQFDESVVKDGEEPIKYIRLKYTCNYSKDKNRVIENRAFLDQNNEVISGKNTSIRKNEHMSYFPFFYLETLRNIQSEIKSSSSFWGKIKKSVDYSAKERKIGRLMKIVDKLLISDEEKLNEVIEKLKEIENSIKISNDADNISLKAMSSRSWELLDGLTFYLKTADSNISLPIDKHGMGTQNIAIFSIFNAYLDILLPQIIENEEVTPIIGIEEPEAHVYPHSQRAIFEQLNKINGQKIVSTHSPYIVDQANITDFILFRNVSGETKVKKLPLYKQDLQFGLPEIAYEKNLFLTSDDKHSLKRYIQYKNTELLFSSILFMCEGDSEKIFFEMLGKKILGSSLGRLGVSVIACDGKNYAPFLKIAKKQAFDLSWFIFSDGEEDTKEEVKSAVESNGFNSDHITKNVIFLPEGKDFESYCISSFGEEVFLEIISQKFGKGKFAHYKKNIEKQHGREYTDFEVINKFIDGHSKTLFAEYLAEYILQHDVELPSELNEQFKRIKEYFE
ncbi:ATP-dependent nuclease [Halobacillus halophilus]|uniref:ATP-dependent nuclease n=1 Tax=Halobacillus halophilus TaxID=1570 RepID=UPI001371425C|nr:AAA family ATPase [Halobacillus halophilus]